MKTFFLMLLLTACAQAQTQYAVTFHITAIPAYQEAKTPVFVAGDFNNWNPNDAAFITSDRSLTIHLPKGTYNYKFTRGSWETVESASGGNAIENRTITVENDTTVDVSISGWTDHFPKSEKKSTASKNVQIIDTAFYIPQLNRHRRIWIYLPESYYTARKKYPVLYMQDGQNVYDEATSYAGEWGVDETLDTLGAETGESVVVAIDNGSDKRMNEYSPFDMPRYGKGEGDAYVDFIVKTLKPFIEKHYRVFKRRRHNAIAGSSMGGLISFYAMLKYPKAFGAAGIFSPSFWVAPEQLKELIAAKGKEVKSKIYFYAGKEENENMVPDMMAVFGQLNKVSKAKLTTVIRTGGKHNESQWRQEFPLFYAWLMK